MSCTLFASQPPIESQGIRQLTTSIIIPELFTIQGNIEQAVTPELWSIESKSEAISSKIDDLKQALDPDLDTITSKLDIINVETWSIESNAKVISSKLDILNSNIDLTSKLDLVITENWSIESKAEVISSKVDLIGNDSQELWSIESKAEVISSKLDNLSPVPITPSGTLALKQAVGTIYSAMIDGTATNPTNNLTPVSVRDSDTTKLLKNAIADFYKIPSQQYVPAASSGTITISSAGSYFLYQDSSATNITISAANVTLDLNGFTCGTITIDAFNNVTVKNGKSGAITLPTATGILLTDMQITGDITGGTTTNLTIQNCQIIGNFTAVIASSSIKNCFINGNITPGASSGITIDQCHIYTGSITNAATQTTITNCSIDTGSIALISGSDNTEISNCTISNGSITTAGSVTRTAIRNCQISTGNIRLDGASQISLYNCQVSGATSAAGNITIGTTTACSDVYMNNCISQSTGSNAKSFDIQKCTRGTFYNCKAMGGIYNMYACFYIKNDAANEDISLECCTAQSLSIAGFYFAGGINIICKQCVAVGFTRYGFYIQGAVTGIVLEKCNALQPNDAAAIGFYNENASATGIVSECIACLSGVNSYGFQDTTASGLVKYISNVATSGTTAGANAYNPTSGAPFSPVVRSGTAGYWSNVY
jgi:hypothetical protein